MNASERWARDLAEWAIPDHILAAAPASPWTLPPSLFRAPDRPDDTPSRRRALEALDGPEGGGSVIDVGAGAGAASLALIPAAARIVAVDASAEMLDAFAAAADEAGVSHDEVRGTWPAAAAAAEAGIADVVVCHHVLYNVTDLIPFVRALTAAARRRVVVEITAQHPRARTNALFERFHGIARPERPIAGDVLAVLAEAGITAAHERFTRPPRDQHMAAPERVAFVRSMLCLPSDRDDQIAAAMRDTGFDEPRETVTIWWDGAAP